jgi:hypothetical protein
MGADAVKPTPPDTLIHHETWHDQAACAGLIRHPDDDLWHSDLAEDRARARRICAGCDVRVECAQAGLSSAWGVWGGLDPAPRRACRQDITDGNVPDQADVWSRPVCAHCARPMRKRSPGQRYCPDRGCAELAKRGRKTAKMTVRLETTA